MPNITSENVEVFTWLPHLLTSTEASAELVRKIIGQGYLNGYFMGHDGYLDGKIVCDAGCGRGVKTCALASLNPKLVVGIDASAPSIDAAKELATSLGSKNVEFVHGYLENLVDIINTKGIGKVDFVFNSFNIHHVEDWRKLIHDFSEILHPGGVLYINWVTLGRGWGSFLIKNRIAFALGKDKESRLRIGKRLFGKWDKKYNKSNMDWEAYYADRYSAFYRFITTSQMKRALRYAGFEIVQTDPTMDALDSCLATPETWKRSRLARVIRRLPMLAPSLSYYVRLRQFTRGGDIRAFVCVKTARPNLLEVAKESRV